MYVDSSSAAALDMKNSQLQVEFVLIPKFVSFFDPLPACSVKSSNLGGNWRKPNTVMQKLLLQKEMSIYGRNASNKWRCDR
eukprot:SAG31_NODE_723_length_12568_cov_3.102494_10_plen_81_part_00